jgi:hypothetical protein
MIENYEVKLRLGANGPVSEKDIVNRVARFSVAAANEDMVLNQTRQVLCSHGVVTMMFPAYHAFTRELGMLAREAVSTETLTVEMMATAEKWVMRGLRREVLLDIALNIYNLEPPPDPSG